MSPKKHKDPYEAADKIAHKGRKGSIVVSVPKLGNALRNFGELKKLEDLETFQSKFTAHDRMELIDQAIDVLDTLYVHRDLKWARHAANGSRALRSLRRIAEDLSDLAFHTQVSQIFKTLRDIHTTYILPSPYRTLAAFLPFKIAACKEDNESASRIIVNDLLQDFHHPHFRVGAEVLNWNGLAIRDVIKQAGYNESGGNKAACFALGVRLMTVRWLGTSQPPNANWVTIGYLDPDDRSYHEIRLSWRILQLSKQTGEHMILPIQALWEVEKSDMDQLPLTTAMDTSGLVQKKTTDSLFRASGLEQNDLKSSQKQAYPPPPDPSEIAPIVGDPLPVTREKYFKAFIREAHIDGKKVKVGHLRILNFDIVNTRFFVQMFQELLEKMPKDYLVIDIRSNPGGNLCAAERCMQFLTPFHVKPLKFQFRATREAERLTDNDGGETYADLAPWIPRVSASVINGQQYSRTGILTDEARANVFGQKYYGTVALLTDAITYSSGDIFAAHFADLRIGEIIGVDPTTGGGGGNMIFHGRAAAYAPEGLGLRPLPHDAHMHYAIRRYVRDGNDGEELVEEAGIKADHHIPPTHDDLMFRDRSLFQKIVNVMVDNRRRMFVPSLRTTNRQVIVDIKTDPDLDPLHLDIFIDDRPYTSKETTNGNIRILLRRDPSKDMLVRIEAHTLMNSSFDRPRRKLEAVIDRLIPAR